MADSKRLTDEQLTAIRERWLLRHKAHVVNVYGQAELYRKWLDAVGDDETALLDDHDALVAELEKAQDRYDDLLTRIRQLYEKEVLNHHLEEREGWR